PDALVLKLRFWEVSWNVKKEAPSVPDPRFLQEPDQGLADPQLVQQRKEPRDGYHARCPAQTQGFSEAVGTESDRSGSVDPMYRGVFAAPRPHGSGTSGRGRSLRTAAPGADCALLGPEDAATVVARVGLA